MPARRSLRRRRDERCVDNEMPDSQTMRRPLRRWRDGRLFNRKTHVTMPARRPIRQRRNARYVDDETGATTTSQGTLRCLRDDRLFNCESCVQSSQSPPSPRRSILRSILRASPVFSCTIHALRKRRFCGLFVFKKQKAPELFSGFLGSLNGGRSFLVCGVFMFYISDLNSSRTSAFVASFGLPGAQASFMAHSAR